MLSVKLIPDVPNVVKVHTLLEVEYSVVGHEGQIKVSTSIGDMDVANGTSAWLNKQTYFMLLLLGVLGTGIYYLATTPNPDSKSPKPKRPKMEAPAEPISLEEWVPEDLKESAKKPSRKRK